MRQLPPMNAIKGFEAVVRLGNHKDAAAELGVTHGAVSRQIKVLEDYFGCRLFQPSGRQLVPTELARYYAGELGAVLDRVSQATQRVREPALARKVQVSGTSSMLMHWLMPRMPAFQGAHPSVEVAISATRAAYAKVAASNDVVFRRHPMRRDGFQCRVLFRDRRILVCTPELLARTGVEQPKDVLKHTLLFTDGRTEAGIWDRWMASNGLTSRARANRMKFDHMFVQINAVASGLGFALLSEVLMDRHLRDGTLVTPFPETSISYPSLHVLSPDEDRSSPGVRSFMRWLIAEGGKMTWKGGDDDEQPEDFQHLSDPQDQPFALN